MTTPVPDLKTLANKHCTVKPRVIDDQALADIAQSTLTEWTLRRDESNVAHELERTISFENFYAVMSYVNAIAPMIHREDHHPQMQITFNSCRLQWHTHTLKGVSMNDVICAAKCDVILQRHHPLPTVAKPVSATVGETAAEPAAQPAIESATAPTTEVAAADTPE